MSAPLISVITPVYNIQDYIGEAIESVLKQTLQDFELILVDDCSTDNSKAIMEEYAQKDPRIKIFSTPVNSWAHAAGNVGLENATGKYIAILDGDDILISDRLEKQAQFLETNSEYDVVGGWMKKFGESDTIMNTFLRDDLKIRMGQLFDSTMGHGTAMIRRELIEKFNIRYDTNIFYAHDYHFFTQLAFKANARFTSLPEIVYLYRWHSEQTSIARRDEQIKFSDQVRKEVLAYFGITASQHIEIHLHFCHKQSYKITAPHCDIIAYYDALISGNIKSGIFPEIPFKQYLAAKLCKDMSRSGLGGLKFYLSFPDKKHVTWSLLQKIQFTIKCLRPKKR
jgi:glycosyltransferase involved in cell wall biosynthesis